MDYIQVCADTQLLRCDRARRVLRLSARPHPR